MIDELKSKCSSTLLNSETSIINLIKSIRQQNESPYAESNIYIESVSRFISDSNRFVAHSNAQQTEINRLQKSSIIIFELTKDKTRVMENATKPVDELNQVKAYEHMQDTIIELNAQNRKLKQELTHFIT